MRAVVVMTVLLGIFGACAAQVPARTPADGTLHNGNITLAYHLDRPDGPGPFPAIVLGHGSGQVTRDQMGNVAHEWVSRGYAVLRYDKRGVGQSTGTYSGVGVRNGDRMFADLSSDMVTGVEFLRRQPEIDGTRIGLMGASQAGWIIPLAARQARVAFMILLSGPAVSIGEENYYSQFAEHGGTTLERAYDELSRFTGPRGFDPVPTLETLDTPGLWLLGTRDESIPERNTVQILHALAARGRPYTVIEYSGANHGLYIAETGQFAPFWADIDRWLRR